MKHQSTISNRELAIFALLASIMYLSKIFMEWAPNIHLLGMLTMAYTIVYRKKALIPIYVYILLNGIMSGFATWWIPYLYIWAVLWGITMLLPKEPRPRTVFLYSSICGLHGLLFGILYAPFQALIFGLNFEGTIAWIIAGFPFDIMHGIGNFAAGFLILPLVNLLRKLESITHN